MNKKSGIDTSIATPSSAAVICLDAETDSSSDGSITSPIAKKVKRQQTFRASWLKDPQFQLWLEATDHPLQAKCTVCVKYFTASRTVLKNHANSMTHSTNMQRKAGASISVPSDAATARSIDTSVAGPSSAPIVCSDAESHPSSEHIFATASINTSVTGASSAAIIYSDAESDSRKIYL